MQALILSFQLKDRGATLPKSLPLIDSRVWEIPAHDGNKFFHYPHVAGVLLGLSINSSCHISESVKANPTSGTIVWLFRSAASTSMSTSASALERFMGLKKPRRTTVVPNPVADTAVAESQFLSSLQESCPQE